MCLISKHKRAQGWAVKEKKRVHDVYSVLPKQEILGSILAPSKLIFHENPENEIIQASPCNVGDLVAGRVSSESRVPGFSQISSLYLLNQLYQSFPLWI